MIGTISQAKKGGKQPVQCSEIKLISAVEVLCLEVFSTMNHTITTLSANTVEATGVWFTSISVSTKGNEAEMKSLVLAACAVIRRNQDKYKGALVAERATVLGQELGDTEPLLVAVKQAGAMLLSSDHTPMLFMAVAMGLTPEVIMQLEGLNVRSACFALRLHEEGMSLSEANAMIKEVNAKQITGGEVREAMMAATEIAQKHGLPLSRVFEATLEIAILRRKLRGNCNLGMDDVPEILEMSNTFGQPIAEIIHQM